MSTVAISPYMYITLLDIKMYLEKDAEPIEMSELMEFWESCTPDQRTMIKVSLAEQLFGNK